MAESEPDAYGEVVAVPALLARLAAGAGDEATVADVADRLAHQGFVTPAARPAVGPLLALAAAGDGAVGAALLGLLGDLALAGDHANFLGTVRDDEAEAFAMLSDPGVADVRAAVRAGADVLRGRLAAGRAPRVRAAAGLALAAAGLVDAMDAVAAAVRAEDDAQARGDLRVALAWLAARAGGAYPATPAPDGAADEAGAALAAGYRAGTLDESEVWALYGLLDPLLRSTESVWAAGDVARHAARIVARQAARGGDVRLLADALELAPEALRGELSEALLGVALGRPGGDPERGVVLGLLAGREDLWSAALRDRLRGAGLPASPTGLRQWLGIGPEATPFDRRIEVAERRDTVAAHWGRAATEGSDLGPALVEAVVGQVPAREWAALLIEATWAEVAAPLVSYGLVLEVARRAGEGLRPTLHAELRGWYAAGPPSRIDAAGFTRSGSHLMTVFWLALWLTRATAEDERLLRRVRPDAVLIGRLARSERLPPELRERVADATRWRERA